MGLITCPECKNRISSFAHMCVYCGCPMQKINEINKAKEYINSQAGKNKTRTINKYDNLIEPKQPTTEFNKSFYIEYTNENEFRKKERAVKKYNMLAYKKLMFDYYPAFREGRFFGDIVSKDENNDIIKFELKLPTDSMFSKVHGDIVLHYTVYKKELKVELNTLTPEDILNEGHHKELTTYKDVVITKSHRDIDIFKINLLNSMTNKDNF